MNNLKREFVAQFYSFYFSWGFYFSAGLNMLCKNVQIRIDEFKTPLYLLSI